MLFPNSVLCPDALPDPRAALASLRPLLRPIDLLASAARHGGGVGRPLTGRGFAVEHRPTARNLGCFRAWRAG